MMFYQKMNFSAVFEGDQIKSTQHLLLRFLRVHGVAAVTHLTFGSDAYVSVDRCIGPQVERLLDADISQRVFSKDRTSVKVGGHEATEARQCLVYERRTTVNSNEQQHSIGTFIL